jgi:hypothetical protein
MIESQSSLVMSMNFGSSLPMMTFPGLATATVSFSRVRTLPSSQMSSTTSSSRMSNVAS